MGENHKVQILTQEKTRRLGNKTEDMAKEDYEDIVNNYCQKLINSGYGEDQTRRIVMAGIRKWEGQAETCKAIGRRIRRIARESQGTRTRTKLIGRLSWLRKKKGQNKD